jgi:uncharacterized protein with HEPN domain
MSERRQQEYLADMREAIVRIQTYTTAITYGQFLADSKTQDAVIRNIEILGEAAKHVPTTLTRAHPEIEWKSIAGMRDKLVHDYFGVNLDILWDVLTTKLPALLKLVDDIIQERPRGAS